MSKACLCFSFTVKVAVELVRGVSIWIFFTTSKGIALLSNIWARENFKLPFLFAEIGPFLFFPFFMDQVWCGHERLFNPKRGPYLWQLCFYLHLILLREKLIYKWFFLGIKNENLRSGRWILTQHCTKCRQNNESC